MAMLYSLVPMAFYMALLVPSISGRIDQHWYNATATFYGDMNGGETMQGACGYGNLFKQGYGLETTALSTALFNEGLACGSCYEIKCINEPGWEFCVKNARSIKVTATNFCPPNYVDGGWCNPPQKHFDLSMKMFTTIALYRAGIVSVNYRRVPCIKKDGVKFELTGNPYWLLVLVYNVANAGDIKSVSIKGSKSGWFPMTHNWGEHWNTGQNLVGQTLSFQVTTSDGKMLQFDNVVPANWKFGGTYQSKQNF